MKFCSCICFAKMEEVHQSLLWDFGLWIKSSEKMDHAEVLLFLRSKVSRSPEVGRTNLDGWRLHRNNWKNYWCRIEPKKWPEQLDFAVFSHESSSSTSLDASLSHPHFTVSQWKWSCDQSWQQLAAVGCQKWIYRISVASDSMKCCSTDIQMSLSLNSYDNLRQNGTALRWG